MILESKIYAVSDRVPGVSDESWYEYRVRLLDDENCVIDEWDSLFETYNGVKGQRLRREAARNAVREIRDDVENGEADSWFDIPNLLV